MWWFGVLKSKPFDFLKFRIIVEHKNNPAIMKDCNTLGWLFDKIWEIKDHAHFF